MLLVLGSLKFSRITTIDSKIIFIYQLPMPYYSYYCVYENQEILKSYPDEE